MPLPDHLERLKHIPIDTLSLSDHTSALLRWYSITSILDCIAVFYGTVHKRGTGALWPRLFRGLFGEARPKLIAAGYWDLVLDAEVWRALKEYKWHILHRTHDPEQKIVRWQGQDQNLYEMPFEQLGLTEGPDMHFKTMGGCIGYFLRRFSSNSAYWGEIDKYNDHYREAEPKSEFYQYMFGVVQPRLVELGYWRFVEEHIDDVKEEPRFWAEFVWEDDDGEWET